MSTFYNSLDIRTNMQFKRRKKRFKRGKPCAICGKKYAEEEMMVAHLTPVSDLSTYAALYDQSNWEVRCIHCEHELNRQEDRERANQERLQSLLKKRDEALIDNKEGSN